MSPVIRRCGRDNRLGARMSSKSLNCLFCHSKICWLAYCI